MFVCRICEDFHSPENMKQDLSTHITPLSLELSKLKVRQTIITINSEIHKLNTIPIKTIPCERPFSFLRSGITAYKQIQKMKETPDIIHYHNPRFSGILTKKKQLPPIVMTIHDSPKNILESIKYNSIQNTKQTLYYYYLTKWASKKADAFICVSPGVRDEVIHQWKLNPKKVHVATTGANTTQFHPTSSKKDIDLLYVGRLVEKKRPQDFIKIVINLKKKHPNIKSTMIGVSKKDPLYNKITATIEKHNLSKNIKIIETVPQKTLCNYYNHSKILILPSISESAPKVTLEAMACETPVITTKITGNIGISIDKKTGYLIQAKDTEELTKKTEELLLDENLRKEMGAFARKRIQKKFTWKATAKKHIEIYKSLLY